MIVPSLANRGPIIVVKELVSQFVRNKHFCEVYYFDDIFEVDFDCPVFKIKKGDIVDFANYDIVHSHGLRPDRYVYKYKLLNNNTLFVTTLHNYVFQDLRYEYNWLVSFVFGNLWIHWLKKHDKIVTLSQDAQNYYSNWITNDKLTFAYNTRNPNVLNKLNSQELNELISFKGDSVLIGVSALLTYRKGIDLLLKTLPLINNYKLFIIGDGKSRKKLEKLSIKLNISERCYFAGYKLDAYRYLEHFDVFAMPSRSEGFPLSLLEASVYSVPVLASNLPVIKEAFSDDEVSFFDLSSPSTILDAIINIPKNKKMGKNLNAKYLRSYSPEKMYNRYLAIYNREI